VLVVVPLFVEISCCNPTAFPSQSHPPVQPKASKVAVAMCSSGPSVRKKMKGRKIFRISLRSFCQETGSSAPSTKSLIERNTSLEKHHPSKNKTLSIQEKEKIASIGFVSPEEAQKMEKRIIFNRVHGITGLFISFVLLGTGCTLLLQ
jgi:hypothetical protein